MFSILRNRDFCAATGKTCFHQSDAVTPYTLTGRVLQILHSHRIFGRYREGYFFQKDSKFA